MAGLTGCGEDEAGEPFVRLIVAEFEAGSTTVSAGTSRTLILKVTADNSGLDSDFGRLGIRVKLDPNHDLGEGVTAEPLDAIGVDDEGHHLYPCTEPAEAPGQSKVDVVVRITVAPGTTTHTETLLAYVDIEPLAEGEPSPDATTDELAIVVTPGGLGNNLLINPGFDQAVAVGSLPTAPGNWRGDVCSVVAAELGIAPHGAPNMLKFGATGTVPSATLVSSQQWQIVDLTSFATEIAAGRAHAAGSIWVNRVTGDASTDRRFDLRVLSFGGSPEGMPAAYAASAWLDAAVVTLVSAGDQWQELNVGFTIPAQTSYILFEVYAYEDVVNDAAAPEFAGHFADDAALVVTAAPARSPNLP
jgi:hypothetical protein